MGNACSANLHCYGERQFRSMLPTIPSVGTLFALICLFNFMDVVISLELVTTAADEFNPFIAMLMDRFGRLPAFLGPKLISLSLLAVGVFSTEHPTLFTRRMLCFVTLVYGLLVSYLLTLVLLT